MDRVLELCDRLRADGIDAWIDQYETAPPEGWPRWCACRVEEADFVLVVCTEIYDRRFRGVEDPGKGLGVRWEGYIVVQELYEAGARNAKYIPVLWPPASAENVPLALRGATRYDLSSDALYRRLYRHLTSQPETPAPPLGEHVPMPPRGRQTARFSAVPEPRYEDDRTRALGETLAAAQRRFKELSITGRNVDDVREQILGLRREMRDGGRLQPGDFLGEGRFQLLEIAGRGGFAVVWKAWDEERKALVAVKILHGLHAEDRMRRERFFRGARKMAELHHPGIVRVIEAELEESGKHFFVMGYVGGGDLRQAVLAGELPQEKVLPIILAVGETLAFAHEKGIIHRDVKPANILLDGGRPKLTDFDLVRAFDTTGGTQTQGLLGTVLYSAPEMLGDAKSAGAAADIYSLAMTAVFAFYGKDLPPDVWRRPEVFLEKLLCPPALRQVLGRGISWEPENRPGSVAELCQELSRAVEEPAAGEERLHEVDGTVLLYVPGGEYILGAEDVNEAAKPIHRVVLSPFWIAKYPVTNEQYGRYMAANKDAAEPAYWSDKRFNQPRQPVVGVSWEEAQAYCRWAGLCLPSEAQWEAAARGTDQRRYPWGNREPTPEHANFGDRLGGTAPVGSYPKGAGPFGALDQSGNVWEWCEDVWDAAAFRERAGQRDPLSTASEVAVRCLRGGSWVSVTGGLGAAFRGENSASYRVWYYGFRCLSPLSPILNSTLSDQLPGRRPLAAIRHRSAEDSAQRDRPCRTRRAIEDPSRSFSGSTTTPSLEALPAQAWPLTTLYSASARCCRR